MKTIAIEDHIWKELTFIQIAMAVKTYGDVIHNLIINYKIHEGKQEEEEIK